MLKRILRNWGLYPYAVILTTALILVFIWFKDGYILGTAEAMIPFYNLNYMTEVVRWSWSEYPGLGNANEILLAYYPTYFVLSLLQQAGIPGFVIEAGILWLVLVSAGVGVYLLTRELFPENNWKFNIFASFFYWFNLISLVNIWNRFLFAYMFFWALLPLALFIFIRGLKLRKFSFAVGVGLLSGIFSTGLAAPSFDILLWVVLIYATVFWMLMSDIKNRIFSIKFFVTALISFTLINFWWIGQVVNYMYFGRYSQDVSSFFNDSVSLTTFNSISKNLGNLIDLFRFMHITFFNLPIIDWAKLYEVPLVVTLEFLISGIILFHILKNHKSKNILFLGLLFIVAIFFMKGSNPPLGFPLSFLFEYLSPLHYFRNPFEKFGFLLPLAAAPLLSNGLRVLVNNFRNRYTPIIYTSFFLIFLLLYGYPYFTGLVFTSISPPNNDYTIGFKVKVPEYYKEADQFMKSLGNNFRFIGFPLGDEGITYKWEKGYQGVELSSVLFASPIILFRTSVPYYDVIEQKLEELLLRSPDFTKIANFLNVKYLMLRSDIDYQERNMRSPQIINSFLEERAKKGELKEIAKFGNLTFWENLKWQDKTVYPVSNIAYVYPTAKIEDLSFTNDLTVLGQGEIDNKLKQKANLFLIHPDSPPKLESISPDNSQLIYYFQVAEDGEYELIINNQFRYIDDLKLISDKLEFTIDSLPKTKLIQPFTYSLGKFNFTKGLHKITVNRTVTDSIIQTSSLNLNSLNNQSQLELQNFDPYARYLVDLNYSFKNPGKMIFQIAHDNDSVRNNKIVSRFTRLFSSGIIFQNAQYFFDYYEPNVSADWAKAVFQIELGADVGITDFRIRKIIDLEPVLVKRNDTSDISSDLPQIIYTKINPTKYKVHVSGAKNSFILVLSELFNNGWEARFDDNSLAYNHFLANAYANGWFIDKTGDFNLTLEFAPQRLLRVGKVVSAVSFLGGLIYIGGTLLKKKVKSK